MRTMKFQWIKFLTLLIEIICIIQGEENITDGEKINISFNFNDNITISSNNNTATSANNTATSGNNTATSGNKSASDTNDFLKERGPANPDDINNYDFTDSSGSGSGEGSHKKQYILDQHRQQPNLYQNPYTQYQNPYQNPYQRPAMAPMPGMAPIPGIPPSTNTQTSNQNTPNSGNMIAPPPPKDLPPNDELSVMDIIMKENKLMGASRIPNLANDQVDKAFLMNDETGRPEEIFEGDIVKTPALALAVEEMKSLEKEGLKAFDAINGGQWPRAVVPYAFASYFSNTGRRKVFEAIADFKKYTCIRFIPRTNQRDYVYFYPGGGCSSMIGRQGGMQRISLANGCLIKGIVIHEMMHALGFYHEQSRRDRDTYIVINFNNVRRGMEYNFQKYRSGRASTLGEPYDKNSVMHYGNYAFSINGRKTIYSRSNYNEQLGQRAGMSTTDIKQLNKYYSCQTTPITPKPSPKPSPKPPDVKNKYNFCTKTGRSFCKYSEYAAVCRSTCCFDRRDECKGWVRYCKDRRFANYMKTNCKKTCGLC